MSRVYLPHCFDAVGALVVQIGEQGGDGCAEQGMTKFGGNLGQRRENEAALGEAGMRQGEPGRADDEVAEQEQVEIERARAVGQVTGAVATVVAFRGEEEVEQRFRIERGGQGDGCVHKGGLVCKADGFGAVERGSRSDCAGASEIVHRGDDGLLGRAGGRGEIGSERNGSQAGHKATVHEARSRTDATFALCSKAMRIGFFGGSFDPPHRGHIALARLAMENVALERVIFAPVGVQPLKRDRPQASFADRVEMTALAIAGETGMELSQIDAPRADGRPNYTVETVRALRETLPGDDQLFCLMGADSFLSISKWYRAADLLVACDFVVAARPGFDLGRITSALPASISVAACDEASGDNLVLCLIGAAHREARLYLLPHLQEPASATGIRRSLRHGEEPQWDLDPAVAAYIAEHGLYRDTRAS